MIPPFAQERPAAISEILTSFTTIGTTPAMKPGSTTVPIRLTSAVPTLCCQTTAATTTAPKTQWWSPMSPLRMSVSSSTRRRQDVVKAREQNCPAAIKTGQPILIVGLGNRKLRLALQHLTVRQPAALVKLPRTLE